MRLEDRLRLNAPVALTAHDAAEFSASMRVPTVFRVAPDVVTRQKLAIANGDGSAYLIPKNRARLSLNSREIHVALMIGC